MATKIQRFLRHHPVFTYTDFACAVLSEGGRSPNTIKALLSHHIQQGHIVRVRRRLFAAIPVGADPDTYPINPYLIAGHARPDAIIAYHSALSFHNMAYSTSYRFVYLTNYSASTFSFRNEHYEGILVQPTLSQQAKINSFVQTEDVQGLNIRITSLERTLVDVLDKPLLGGGWEEVWRSLALIDHVKVNSIVDYALLLNKASTIAKVGFYLSVRQKEWGIAQDELNRLLAHRPQSPYYIDASAKSDGKFINEWNIIVPKTLLTQAWEEEH